VVLRPGTYLLSNCVMPGDDTELEILGTLRVMPAITSRLTADCPLGQNWVTVEDARPFRVGQWLTIIDAISGFLFQSYVTGILSVVDRQADWDRLLLSDHLTDLLGLIYFGYLVYLLQFEREVKQIFLHPEDDRNRIPPPS